MIDSPDERNERINQEELENGRRGPFFFCRFLQFFSRSMEPAFENRKKWDEKLIFSPCRTTCPPRATGRHTIQSPFQRELVRSKPFFLFVSFYPFLKIIVLLLISSERLKLGFQSFSLSLPLFTLKSKEHWGLFQKEINRCPTIRTPFILCPIRYKLVGVQEQHNRVVVLCRLRGEKKGERERKVSLYVFWTTGIGK